MFISLNTAIIRNVTKSFLSNQSHKPFKSESSKIFSSRVTRTVESLRVIGLLARVSVKSNEIPHSSYVFFCYEMAPNMVQNGAR